MPIQQKKTEIFSIFLIVQQQSDRPKKIPNMIIPIVYSANLSQNVPKWLVLVI